MNATSIEWVRNPDGSQGYTLNPCSGCENHTPEGLCLGGLFPCYAYKLAHTRLRQRYLANKNFACLTEATGFSYAGQRGDDPFYPRFWEERAAELDARNRYIHDINQAPSRRGIFVCDMGDLFGVGVPEMWTTDVLNRIDLNDGYDRFYLLTKQPQNLMQWSPFPENCYVGVTATSFEPYGIAGIYLPGIGAKVKFISFEPLLGRITDDKAQYNSEMMAKDLQFAGINWLIIGACTGSYDGMKALCERYPQLDWSDNENFTKFVALPKIEWVQEIVSAADRAGIPVFQKNNLKPLLGDNLRQELPS